MLVRLISLLKDPCANIWIDILERFQLSIYLIIIASRNLSEVNFLTLPFSTLLSNLIIPASMVYLSELLVDWLKHAFITKFNHIHPDVYTRFMDTLSKDFEHGHLDHGTLADQSPAVSRRIGFSTFPLTCLLIRITLQTIQAKEILSGSSLLYYGPIFYIMYHPNLQLLAHKLPCACRLVSLKLTLGMALIKYTRARNEQNDYRLIKTDPSHRDAIAQPEHPTGTPQLRSVSMEEPSNKVKSC